MRQGLCSHLAHLWATSDFVPRTFACIVLAFTLGDRLAVDKPPSVHEVRPKVVIHGKEFLVLEHYPKDAFGRL